jgi:hypothetical protein
VHTAAEPLTDGNETEAEPGNGTEAGPGNGTEVVAAAAVRPDVSGESDAAAAALLPEGDARPEEEQPATAEAEKEAAARHAELLRAIEEEVGLDLVSLTWRVSPRTGLHDNRPRTGPPNTCAAQRRPAAHRPGAIVLRRRVPPAPAGGELSGSQSASRPGAARSLTCLEREPGSGIER